jgi:hypothetical protein
MSCRPDIPVGQDARKQRDPHPNGRTLLTVQTLLDLPGGAGDSIDEFLAGFPSVRREQVIKFLEQAKDRLVAAAS